VREVQPRVHCFGHVHDSSGIEERDGTIFVNAAICDRQYWPTNPVRVLDI
jgi:Icc-related predicted phosphoesterase